MMEFCLTNIEINRISRSEACLALAGLLRYMESNHALQTQEEAQRLSRAQRRLIARISAS